jgi:hypothetical protein
VQTPASRTKRPASVWDCAAMWPTQTSAPSPLEARSRIAELKAERQSALDAGLGGNATYMRDLDADIAHSVAAYVGIAVTEIASLRAQLGAPLQG